VFFIKTTRKQFNVFMKYGVGMLQDVVAQKLGLKVQLTGQKQEK